MGRKSDRFRFQYFNSVYEISITWHTFNNIWGKGFNIIAHTLLFGIEEFITRTKDQPVQLVRTDFNIYAVYNLLVLSAVFT